MSKLIIEYSNNQLYANPVDMHEVKLLADMVYRSLEKVVKGKTKREREVYASDVLLAFNRLVSGVGSYED